MLTALIHRPPLGSDPVPRAVCVGGKLVPTRDHPRAFTMLELVIVMAIVATISTIGVIRYSGALERYRADAAAARLVSDLRLAQSTARLRSAASTVTFDQSRSRYIIANQYDQNTRTGSMIVRLGNEPTRATITRCTLDGADAPTGVLTFDGYGRPLAELFVRVQVGSSYRDVSVDPIGGRVYASVP